MQGAIFPYFYLPFNCRVVGFRAFVLPHRLGMPQPFGTLPSDVLSLDPMALRLRQYR
jgi:hypothetical protein